MRLRWSPTALLLVVALAGCAAQPNAPPSSGDTSRNVVNDARIENRRWLLVELYGRAVAAAGDRERAFMELDGANARVAGNASCNRFSGTYELTAGDRLRFGPDIVATRMACGNLEQEGQFLDMLGRVESYALASDTLSLSGGDAPLARFRTVDE
jgi:heat shock protein HslJ